MAVEIAKEYSHVGKPFVGLVRVHCTSLPDSRSSWYTLIQPTSRESTGGEHRISTKNLKGITDIACLSVLRYGNNICEKLTFSPPPLKRIPQAYGGFCVNEYSGFNTEQRELFFEKAFLIVHALRSNPIEIYEIAPEIATLFPSMDNFEGIVNEQTLLYNRTS